MFKHSIDVVGIITFIIYNFIKTNNILIILIYICIKCISLIYSYFIVKNYIIDFKKCKNIEIHLDDIPYINDINNNLINKPFDKEQTIINAQHLKIELKLFIEQNNINKNYGYYLLTKFTYAIDNFILDSNIQNFKSLDILVLHIIEYIS